MQCDSSAVCSSTLTPSAAPPAAVSRQFRVIPPLHISETHTADKKDVYMHEAVMYSPVGRRRLTAGRPHNKTARSAQAAAAGTKGTGRDHGPGPRPD